MADIQKTDLYKTLQKMPKGGHQHLHLTAGAPIDFLISLTYDDFVYCSDYDGIQIRLFFDNKPSLGFKKCQDIRKGDPYGFDL